MDGLLEAVPEGAAVLEGLRERWGAAALAPGGASPGLDLCERAQFDVERLASQWPEAEPEPDVVALVGVQLLLAPGQQSCRRMRAARQLIARPDAAPLAALRAEDSPAMAARQAFAPTVALFAKEPTRGRSKTRLIPALGEDGALAVATAMLQDLTTRLAAELPAAVRLVLVHAPADAGARLQELVGQPRWEVLPMRGSGSLGASDLGDKLACALEDLRRDNVGPVAFIGMDCPHLPAEEVLRALSGGAYLAPAADGGYVVVGLPWPTPPGVFDGVEWSTERTCESQRAALERAGLEVQVGERAYVDVDEVGDLEGVEMGGCPRLSAVVRL